MKTIEIIELRNNLRHIIVIEKDVPANVIVEKAQRTLRRLGLCDAVSFRVIKGGFIEGLIA